MYEIVKAKLKKHRRQGFKVAVLEAPLLLEAGWTPLVDEVWVTVTPQSKVLKRLRARTGMTEEESLARIRSQMQDEERVKHADIIINNNGDLEELKTKVKEQWQRLAN